MASLVFTVIGPDRPGLVEQLSTCIAEVGGSWQESEFLSLDGQFAGLVRVRIDAERLKTLRNALASLPGVAVTVAPTTERPAPDRGLRQLRLDVVGTDRTGIVQEISRVLAGLGINLLSFESWTERAAMSGEPTFRVKARLDVPSRLEESAVSGALEHLSNDLMVETRWHEEVPT